jgi:exosortase
LLASATATEAARAMGITVYRDGNIIHLANLSLGIAEACSGLRSLLSLLVAALLLGHIESVRRAVRVVLVLLAIPTAVLFNVARVTLTAILGEHNAQWADGFYHSFSGWIVFVGGFGLLLVWLKLLTRLIPCGAQEAA